MRVLGRRLTIGGLALIVAGALLSCSPSVNVGIVHPAPGERDVSLDVVIRLEVLPRPLGPGWETALRMEPEVRGAFSIIGSDLVFVPSETLAPDTTYTIILEHSRLKEGRISFDFTTREADDPCGSSPSQPVTPGDQEDVPPELNIGFRDGLVFLGPLKDEFFQTVEWFEDDSALLVRANRGDWVQFVKVAPSRARQDLLYATRDNRESYIYVSSLLAGDLGLLFITHSGDPERAGLWQVCMEGAFRLLVPQASYFSLCPERRRVLVEGPEGIVYLDLENERELVLESLPQYGFPYSLPGLAWQPGGRFISGEIWSEPSYVYVYDAVGRDWVLVERDTENHYHTPVWSPEGQALAYLSQPALEQYPANKSGLIPAASVHVRELQTGQVRSLALRARSEEDMGVLSAPLWSPDGTFLALAVGIAESQDWHQNIRNEIWGYRWREGRAGLFSITDNESGVGLKLPLGYSPSGRQLLFSVYKEGGMYQHPEFWIADLDNYEQFRLADTDFSGDELAWLPDGRLVGPSRINDGNMALLLFDPYSRQQKALPIEGEWIYSVGVSPQGSFIHAVVRTGEEELLAIIPVD